MRKFLLTAALCLFGSAVGASAVTQLALDAAARSDHAAALRQIRADNTAMRVELDLLRRELMRRPAAGGTGPAQPDPDRIPATNLPTEPKE